MFASMLAAMFLLASVALTQPAVDDADRYIVVLEDGVDNPSQVASGIEQRQDLEVGFVYSEALEGFSATIPDEDLAAVRTDPRVDYVGPDGRVHAVGQTLPWGIDRIGADQSSTEAGNGSGAVSGVNVYIMDTGIYKTHRDLNVVNHINFHGGKNNDCGGGHGTHVAGVAAAKDNDRGVVGVAPGAPLIGVKVLGCDGRGFISDVIAGIDWMTAEEQKPENVKKPAIANLSLSSEIAEAPVAAQALDDAVRGSAESGVFYSVAAGNKGKDACKYSPASAGLADEDTNGDGKKDHRDSNGIVTTAAVNDSRQETRKSNYGDCVDLWAPGAKILSTNYGGGVTKMSGTSMAAPHVGGTAALYLSNSPKDPETGEPLYTPEDAEEQLKEDAENIGTLSKQRDPRAIKRVYARPY